MHLFCYFTFISTNFIEIESFSITKIKNCCNNFPWPSQQNSRDAFHLQVNWFQKWNLHVVVSLLLLPIRGSAPYRGCHSLLVIANKCTRDKSGSIRFLVTSQILVNVSEWGSYRNLIAQEENTISLLTTNNNVSSHLRGYFTTRNCKGGILYLRSWNVHQCKGSNTGRGIWCLWLVLASYKLANEVNVIISVSAPLHMDSIQRERANDQKTGECAVECDHLSCADQSEFFWLGDYY